MRILVVNAVEWGPEHVDLNFPKDVAQWIISAFGGDPSIFEVWKAREEQRPPAAKFNGVVVSGSASSAYDSDPWIGRLSEELRKWETERTPILGLCFGHQLIAQAFGGKVEKNPLGWEVGTCEIELSEAGKADPLYENLPARFKAMESHQDIVTRLPPGARSLASSPMSAHQSMALGELIRTSQFHPEYTEEQVEFLVGPRRGRLQKAGVDVDRVLATLEPTPLATKVLENFRKHFIEEK